MNLSPQDRDLIVRTVIGEAANEPVQGQAAVAHVIFNRLNAGEWGKTPSDVVLAKGQFEPWQVRSRELLAIDPASPEYKNAARVVDSVVSRETPDPTGGATYFLQPDIVRARRGGTLPSWASGKNKQIGAHTFYYGGRGGAPVQIAQADDVSDADVDETRKLLGLGASAPTAAPPAVSAAGTDVTPADLDATARALGITLGKRPAVLAPATASQPTTTPSPPPAAPSPWAPISTQGGYQRQVVEGMPIVAPLVHRGLAAAEAATEPAINPIRRLLGYPEAPMSAPTFAGRYAANLEGIRQSNRRFAQENPVGSTVANLTGGALALGPVGATEAGGIALGMRGPNIGSKIITGALGGSVIGGADAALRGEDPVTGAKIGAVGGAAGPVVGELVQGGTRYVVNNILPRTGVLRGVHPTAVSKLTQAFEGEAPQSLREARARMGPAGFVADINPATTDIAGAVADIPGPGKQMVREAFRARARDQAQRVEQALTRNVGPTTDIEQFRNVLTENRKAAADPLYQAWRDTQVQPTDELKVLIPRLEAAGAFGLAEESAAVRGVPLNKKFFTGGPQKEYPTTESWDLVKRGLDRKIDQAYRAGDNKHAADLVQLKNELVGEIGKTDAGKIWTQARQAFAERSALIDQLEAGRDTFLGGRSGLSVDELKAELQGLSGPELGARIVGVRAAADEAMGATARGDTTLRNKLLAPNNRKKMELLLGKKKADDLIQTMEQEKYLGEQYQNVVGGSQTTPKKERITALQAQPMQPWDFDVTRPGTYLPPSMREQFTPHGLVNAWRGQGAQTAANQLAPLITARTGTPEFSQLVRALRRESLRRAQGAAVGARAGSVLSGLVTGPGTTTARRQYLPVR